MPTILFKTKNYHVSDITKIIDHIKIFFRLDCLKRKKQAVFWYLYRIENYKSILPTALVCLLYFSHTHTRIPTNNIRE